MMRRALLILGTAFVGGALLADTKERDEQDSISLSLATQKPPSSLGAGDAPFAKYMREVKAALGSRWASYISRSGAKLNAQTARVKFSVHRDGAVSDVEILDVETSTEEFRSICIKAVKETKFRAIPKEVLTEVTDPIEIAMRFSTFDLK